MLNHLQKIENMFGQNFDSIYVGIKSPIMICDKIDTKYGPTVEIKSKHNNGSKQNNYVTYFSKAQLVSHFKYAVDQINKQYKIKLKTNDITTITINLRINNINLSSLYHKLHSILYKTLCLVHKTASGSIILEINNNQIYIQNNGIYSFVINNTNDTILKIGMNILYDYNFICETNKSTIII